MKFLSHIFLIFFLINIFTLKVYCEGEEKKAEEEPSAETPNEVPVEDDIEFDENGVPKLKANNELDTIFKFTKPDGLSLELPSGQEVQFLIGVKNNGKKDYVVETIDSSLRYPQDFSLVIQNFTSYSYNRLVRPNQEITLAYSMIINEMFNERPFGFQVNVINKDLTGKLFSNNVFNKTVDIVEINDGINGEILFVYVFLISLVGLIGFIIYKYLFAKRFGGKAKRKVETGTVTNIIDYDWIPSQNLSEKTSPKPTPKPKKTKKAD